MRIETNGKRMDANERVTGKAHGIEQDVYGMKQDKIPFNPVLNPVVSGVLLYRFTNNETM